MRIDGSIKIEYGGGQPMKIEIKSLVGWAIKQAILAVAKLVKTKLASRLDERHCKIFQKSSEKIIHKTSDIVDSILTEKDAKKKAKKVFLLKLFINTLSAVHEAVGETIEMVNKAVNFAELETPEVQEHIASALKEVDGELDKEYDNYIASLKKGTCSDDGCQIC